MSQLAKRIEVELRAGEDKYDIHPKSDGHVDEYCTLATETFDLEFKVQGYLRFYQEYLPKDPQERIRIEPELGINNISVYENGSLLEIEEKDFEKEMEKILLSDCLNETW